MVATTFHTDFSVGWDGQEVRIVTTLVEFSARGHRMIFACQPGNRIGQQVNPSRSEWMEKNVRRVTSTEGENV